MRAHETGRSRNDLDTLDALRGGLIVSCQAEDNDPFNGPDLVARFALAAAMGGAVAIRTREPQNVRSIRLVTTLPIIGLTKSVYADGRVLITPDLADVDALIDAGATLIAVDGTTRTRPNGLTGEQFIRAITRCWKIPVIADVSTRAEGVAAFRAGAIAVATTLAGYTAATERVPRSGPDWKLLKALVTSGVGPVILEGRVTSPRQAGRALALGAHAVVVGTAISRPRLITQSFVAAMR